MNVIMMLAISWLACQIYQVLHSYATKRAAFASIIPLAENFRLIYLNIYRMNRIKGIIIVLTAVLAALSAGSCAKDDTLYYNNVTMGNIVDGRFVSDQGNTFNIVEDLTIGKIDTLKRVLISCDVLNVTKGAKSEYDIRLNQFAPVLDKKPVAAEDAVAEEMLVQDPIHIEQLWYSGGYINMLLRNPRSANNSQKHLINLVWSKENNAYVFNLRHNAFGDVYQEGSTNMTLAGSYVSFPISSLIKEDSAVIKINWKWYKSAGSAWSSEVVDYNVEYDWKRGGFEQTPQTISLSHSAAVR